MSFLGSIGTIMYGSGLKEYLNIIYVEKSVDKIMTRHAYSRAVRAHILVQNVLTSKIFTFIDLNADDVSKLNTYSNDINNTNICQISDEFLQGITRKFNEQLTSLKSNGPTSQVDKIF